MDNDKQCFKCLRRLPRTEFYAHPQMGDGLLGKCKECARKDVQEHRVANREYWKEWDRERYHAGLKTVTRSPEKRTVQYRFHAALAGGRIAKPTHCTDCGCEPAPRELHGHHEDYSKPLDVVWLCRICHMKRHRMDAARRMA